MPFNVDLASIQITISKSGVLPDIDLTLMDQAICNLTTGYTKGGGKSSIRDAFTATLKATVTGNDPLGGGVTDFGFIQFCEQSALTIELSGAKKELGSIALSPAEKPVWSRDTTLLDSHVSFRPWTQPAPRFTFTLPPSPQLVCVTGDHPSCILGLKLQNRITRADNFLRFVKDTRRFWTVFTKKDKSRQPSNQYLVHFQWDLIYGFEMKWRNNRPQKANSFSNIQFGSMVAGPPSDPDVVKLLNENNQGGPDFNEVADAAIKASTNAQPPNRRDEPQWFLSTPQDFFR